MSKDSFFFKLKIPKNIEVFYCNNKEVIILKSHLKTIAIKTYIKLKFIKKNMLLITNKFFCSKNLNFNKKKLNEHKKILRFILLQKIIEVQNNFCIRLKLKGVGYKILFKKKIKYKVFQLKLGFSHQIFICASKMFSIKIKQLEIFVSGMIFQKVTQISADLRMLKTPDSYKGKGILYKNELIKLKQGKKT